ncbi:MAG: aspartate ammonia-lyase [Candidatus Zixiibacteriota bacterium]
MSEHRTEKDSLGEVKVPKDAYWGAQTQRAIGNFPVSGHKPHPGFVWAGAAIKRAAAMVHEDLGLLPKENADAIIQAATEIMNGELSDQFVVDVYQAGAGTSHHMNLNEVIANRALEILGKQRTEYSVINPNDHVNMAQSTNDVIPTSIRIFILKDSVALLDILDKVEKGFRDKAKEFDKILKSGRTHLQDAVPVRLGQEFGGYAETIKRGREKISAARDALCEIGLGGSAAGTGLNVHPEYRTRVAKALAEITGFTIKPTNDYFWAMQSMAQVADYSASLRNFAIELSRIMNDLRLLSSGPTTGIAEIILPPVQPGSSIMPGKVNPVMAEMMNMVCFSIIGFHESVAWAAGAGQLELNVMMPLMAYAVGEQMKILTGGLDAFLTRCLTGIKPNEAACRMFLEKSLGLVTALNPIIGYMKAAEVAKESQKTGKSIKELVVEKGYLTHDEMEKILDPGPLTEPGIHKIK